MRTTPHRQRPWPQRFALASLSLFLGMGLAWADHPAAAPADAAWIVSKLVRPAPMQTSFVELRGSKLLKTPLRIEGLYRRPDSATLVREVRAPYAETTTIRAGEVVISRTGKAPRRFSLSRAPELVALQASFGALLTGDRALLEQHYHVSTQGSRQQWQMRLLPRDAKLAARVRDVMLYGRGAELRCIETRPVQGDLQRTLLAGAARAAVPGTTTAALTRLCTGASA